MDPLAAFGAEADALRNRAAMALGYSGPLPDLETPPDPAMGDLGMPCFALAKALRKAPAAIAAELAKAIPPAPREWVAGASAAGPYLNFQVDAARLAESVLRSGAALFAPSTKKENVLLEHTSANPNGPLHVGRARNPIVGDTLARLLRAAGHPVEVQYYMDNLGRQVATLAWGKWNIPASNLDPAGRDKPDHDLVRYYQAAHDKAKTDARVGAEVKSLVEKLERAEPAVLDRAREVYLACFGGMQESLARLGVEYDTVKDESDFVADGSVAQIIERLRRLPMAGVDDNGAGYLDLSHLIQGQKDKFFFTRGDGSSVYATRDIAYHAWKAKHVAGGRLVNVLGEDHRLQALQVGAALEALEIARPAIVFYAFVSLPEGKMSTRANRVVFLDDLLDEAARLAYAEVQERRGHELSDAQLASIAEAVGVAAVRFNIVRIQPEKPIEFRWEEALDFEGDSAPYLMYAYARASSLVAKAKAAGLSSAGWGGKRLEAGEQRLLSAIAAYPRAVDDAVAHLAPHRFAAFALRLAGSFNEYYRDHRVLECEDDAQQRVRLATMEMGRLALRASLEALGIPVLESM
jgi:arginyl-tRNA synthetase